VFKLISLLFVSALATGCFVEIDAPSIELLRPCDGSAGCTFHGIAETLQTRTALATADGSTELAIDLGEDGILESEYGLGPFSLDSHLSLDELTITALDGVVLDEMQTIEVERSDGQVIAAFRPAHESAREPGTLHIAGHPDVNLLDLGMSFSLRFYATGRMPAENWMADIALRVHLNARVD
jgi:hypothetical protein